MHCVAAVGCRVNLDLRLFYRLRQLHVDLAGADRRLPLCRQKVIIQHIGLDILIIVDSNQITDLVLLRSRHIGVLVAQPNDKFAVFLISFVRHISGVHVRNLHRLAHFVIIDGNIAKDAALLLVKIHIDALFDLIAVVLSHNDIDIISVGCVGKCRARENTGSQQNGNHQRDTQPQTVLVSFLVLFHRNLLSYAQGSCAAGVRIALIKSCCHRNHCSPF